MRLANKPAIDVEGFQRESEQCFQSWQNGHQAVPNGDQNGGDEVDTDEQRLTNELNHIQNSLNVLADHLKRRNTQVLPNQSMTLERMLKEHKASSNLDKI